MTAPAGNSELQQLIGVLQDVWTQDPDVQKFVLTFSPDRIRHATSGWLVPLASGVSTGSAYDLLKTVDRLQQVVEQRSKLDVNLFVDPRIPPAGVKP